MIKELMSNWVFLSFLVFIPLNFFSAILLKDALKATFRENKWLKYIFIFPPLAILAWIVSFIYMLIFFIKNVVTNYFKD
jgi:hypothetical protein